MAALYEKTIAYLLQYIDENGLQPGDQLPPESRLALQAGVSLVTVRRALSELASQCVVRREQGRGTFVLRPRLRPEPLRVGGLRNSLHLDTRSTLQTKLLGSQARHATLEESTALGLPDSADVWEISRLQLLNDRPVIWEVSTIPRVLAPDLGRYIAARDPRSLYDLLDEVYRLKEVREEQLLFSRPARQRETELLGLIGFEWIVEINGVSYSTRNAPIDSFRMTFVARAFAFRLGAVATQPIEAIELAP